MNCIKCTKCNIYCHSFLDTYDELYSPRGYLEISKLLDRGEIGYFEVGNTLDGCDLCGECQKVCPIELDILNILKQTKSKITKHTILFRTKKNFKNFVSFNKAF